MPIFSVATYSGSGYTGRGMRRNRAKHGGAGGVAPTGRQRRRFEELVIDSAKLPRGLLYLGLVTVVVAGLVALWAAGLLPSGASESDTAGTEAVAPGLASTATETGADPATAGGLRADAFAAYEVGRLDEAERLLGEYLTARPDDREAAAAAAQVSWLRGDYDSSAARYETLLAEHGSDPETLYQLALVLRGAGDLEAAAERLEAAAALDVDSVPIRLELARTLRMVGEYERAGVEWESLIAALPPDDAALPGILFELGLTRLQAGDVQAARVAFERGADLRPDDPAFAAQLEAIGAAGAGS